MTDMELLDRAIERSGLSERQFALRELEINDRTLRRWREWGRIPRRRMRDRIEALARRRSRPSVT